MSDCSTCDDAIVSITIPVFNEEESLPRLRERLTDSLGKLRNAWEVVFVNDGSRDGSAQILDEMAASNPHSRSSTFAAISGRLPRCRPDSTSLRGRSSFRWMPTCRTTRKTFRLLLAKLDEGYDVCSGWRQNRKDHALRRNFVSRSANRLISVMSGVHLHDYGCTLKAYRKEVIAGVKLYGEMHRFVPIYASWMGARVGEIPVRHHARKFGQVEIRTGAGLQGVDGSAGGQVPEPLHPEADVRLRRGWPRQLGLGIPRRALGLYLKIFEATVSFRRRFPLLVVFTPH